MRVTERLAGMNKCHLWTIYHICECQPRLSKDLEMDGWRLTIVLCTYVDLKLYCPQGEFLSAALYTSDNEHSAVRHNNRPQPPVNRAYYSKVWTLCTSALNLYCWSGGRCWPTIRLCTAYCQVKWKLSVTLDTKWLFFVICGTHRKTFPTWKEVSHNL